MKVLVVDDQRSAQRVFASILSEIGELEVEVVAVVDIARARLKENVFDVAFVDLRLSDDTRDRSGIDLIQEIARAGFCTPIVVSAFSDLQDLRMAMRAGAHDYLLKDELCVDLVRPILERVRDRVRLEAELVSARARARHSGAEERIIGASAPMNQLRRQLRRVALSDRPVLVRGPTGAGKELVVRAIHELGPHPDDPVVDVNCTALPETLIEAQLFGYEKGAFTGATSRHEGYFAAVGRGTLFLDEIGDLPLHLQAKLLRVLETNRFRPVGSTQDIAFKGRLVAATHVDLEAAVVERRFREDLWYRLNVLTIQVPSLEERREDIPLLVAHFMSQQARKLTFDAAAIEELQTRSWSGNVRQLRNAIDRFVVFAEEDRITIDDVRLHLGGAGKAPSDLLRAVEQIMALDIKNKLDATREALIQHAMQLGGNKTAAARLLGVHRKVIERSLRTEDTGGLDSELE